MDRGYKTIDLKQRLVKLLYDSKTGLSGVDISEKLRVNRVTMTKYLGIFAAKGIINQKNIGNANLWFLDDGVEQYNFPDDYFTVQKRYAELLTMFSQKQVFGLIRNCIHSGAGVSEMIHDVILPSILVINTLFDDGKIGTVEENLLRNIVAESIKILDMVPNGHHYESTKNVIVLSADSDGQLVCDASTALYHSQNWNVFHLGDMASMTDVLFDLDMQKLLSKIWKKKTGIMLVVVFSGSREGLDFFAESLKTVKEKSRKKLFSVMCGPVDKKTDIDADLVTSDLNTVMQWSETVFQSNVASN